MGAFREGTLFEKFEVKSVKQDICIGQMRDYHFA